VAESKVKWGTLAPVFQGTSQVCYGLAVAIDGDDTPIPHQATQRSTRKQLPFGKGKKWLTSGPASVALGDWQLSGILSIYSGIPSFDTANGGTLNSPGSTQTADQIAPVSYPHRINTGNPWFSTSSFAQPVGVAFGSVGRNNRFRPGLFALNVSLFKHFRVTERIDAELRGEAFQLTNTPQFNNPTTSGTNQASLTAATFGYVTSTVGSGSGVNGGGGGRAFQLGVKITF
jgi:hypothetical protein